MSINKISWKKETKNTLDFIPTVPQVESTITDKLYNNTSFVITEAGLNESKRKKYHYALFYAIKHSHPKYNLVKQVIEL